MVNFLDLHDDISLLACFIERANILHQDIEEDFLLPLYNANEAKDFQSMLVCAGTNSYKAKIKAELIDDILSEAITMANSLVYQTLRAREEHNKTEAATDSTEGNNVKRIDEVMKSV